MAKLSLYQKLKLYSDYRSIIIKNKELLEQSGLRIDRVKRIYTVVNVPESIFDNAYDLLTSDINRVSQSYLTEAVRGISKILNSVGLNELYKIYETRKVDKFSYLIVIGFSLMNTKKAASNLYFFVLPTIVTIVALLILFL